MNSCKMVRRSFGRSSIIWWHILPFLAHMQFTPSEEVVQPPTSLCTKAWSARCWGGGGQARPPPGYICKIPLQQWPHSSLQQYNGNMLSSLQQPCFQICKSRLVGKARMETVDRSDISCSFHGVFHTRHPTLFFAILWPVIGWGRFWNLSSEGWKSFAKIRRVEVPAFKRIWCQRHPWDQTWRSLKNEWSCCTCYFTTNSFVFCYEDTRTPGFAQAPNTGYTALSDMV